MVLYFRIKKSPDIILDYLTDMQKFASVHPVISKIEKTTEGKYIVHETLKLGLFPFSFTYPASIESRPLHNTIIIRATVMKLTKIEMTFVLKAEKDATVVEESIKFKTLLPVKFIMEGVFRAQHTQLFKNIESE